MLHVGDVQGERVVGAADGWGVGSDVGTAVGDLVGVFVACVGSAVGGAVGLDVAFVTSTVGPRNAPRILYGTITKIVSSLRHVLIIIT